MRKAIKSSSLEKKLKDAIVSGALPLGTLLPKEIELAAQHSVSRDTLRAALRNLEQQCMIQRIRGKGTIVCAKRQVCTSVKVVLPGPGPLSKRMEQIMYGIVSEAHRHNIRIETIISTFDHVAEHMNIQSFQSLTADDCVILPGLNWWYMILPILADRGCKVACLDTCNSDNSGIIWPYTQEWKVFRLDFGEVMRECLLYLLRKGKHRTIIFSMSTLEMSTYMNELKRKNIKFDQRLFVPYRFGYGICENKKKQRQLLHKFLMPYLNKAIFEAHADSIIFNELNIQGVAMQIFKELGLNLPEDIVAVSVEDYSYWQPTEFAVSSFQFSFVELGYEFVRCFLNEYYAPEIISETPVFIERESSCKGIGNTPGLQENIPKQMPDLNIF